jgi:hypothetical protein
VAPLAALNIDGIGGPEDAVARVAAG